MKSGIYCIRNKINNKVYIGKAVKVKSRISAHKYLLRNNKHVNIHLQNAWNLYKEENFIFSIIEKCERLNLSERETFWINAYKANNQEYGYNLMKVGRYNHFHSEETKLKMSKSSLGRKKSPIHVYNYTLAKYKTILQYDLEGNFIREWLGASYIRDQLGYNQSNITGVCNGLRKTANGFIWKYKKKED